MKVLIVLVLCLCSFGVHAGEKEKQEKLVQIMDMDSIVESMYSQMEIMMQNMSTEMGVQPSEQEIYDEHHSKMTLIVREGMSWKKMKPFVIDMYKTNFNEKEISDILAFYKTDTGKSLIAKMPVVMQESMQMAQTLMRETMPKIQKVAKELSEDLEKARESKK